MSSIKLTADSGGGTFEIKAPSSSGNTRVLTLPDTGNITLPDTNGIKYVDSWRVNTEFTASAGSNDVTANWERDDTNFELIGTGLSQSSGVFGFQETGKFLIRNRFVAYQSSSRRYVGVQLLLSTNGSGGSFSTVVESYDAISASGSNAFAAGGGQKIIDATTTDFYFKFRTIVIDSTVFDCNTAQNRFCFDVIKLGDT
tara:strand:- start:254 stop:850 length:597 start_codon:yes stop_codon:yes gene_type:complete